MKGNLIKKQSLIILLAVYCFLGIAESAHAGLIFEDLFDRSRSDGQFPYPLNDIGNGWTKTCNQDNDVQLRGKYASGDDGILWMRDINASVTHHDSTAGFKDILLTFDWRGNANADLGDTLHLKWFDGSAWNDSGLSLSLANQILTTNTYILPTSAADLSSFSYSFYTSVDMSDEAARLQRVTLTGNYIPAPGALLLGSIGVATIGLMRRRKTL